MASPPILILGGGYTGHWIFRLAQEQHTCAWLTSRDPERHLPEMPPDSRIRFDLADRSTWKNLPEGAEMIWTFPAVPLEAVQAFADTCRDAGHRLVVLGSTSAYDLGETTTTGAPPPWIDESAPINHALPRVQGEEYLRAHNEAIVLRVAGIYGPERNPVEWIRRGRVGRSEKFVNLVHVEDLAALCLLALRTGRPGNIYNVSDGCPRRWTDICDEVERRWQVVGRSGPAAAGAGKRVANGKILSALGYTFRHPDLYRALALLCEPPAAGQSPGELVIPSTPS